MRRAVPILMVLLAGCSFDVHGPGSVPCSTNAGCAPDQECTGARCVYRTCAVARECGSAQAFLCVNATCLAVRCSTAYPCADGFTCGLDGFCWAASCVASVEGPPGSASCRDGVDNDCDGKTDADDPGCRECRDDADCDDGKPCTGAEACVDTACVAGTPVVCTPSATPCRVPFCDDTVTTGSPCVQLPVDDGVACDDGDRCTDDDRCGDGNCSGTARECSDGVSCTDDHCDPADGACVHVPNHSRCNNYERCKPACFANERGCGVPPSSLEVSCASPAPAVTGSACTVALAGLSGQAGCLACEARSPVATPFFSDFDNGFGACRLDGWRFAAGSPCDDTNYGWCVTGFAGSPAVQIDKAECAGKTAVLERTVDTTGFERVDLCFSYADRGAAGGNDSLRLEYDPSGTGSSLVQLFADVDGPLPGLDDTWLRYCVALPADAVGQPGVLLRVTLHSNDAGQKVLVDRLSVVGRRAGCALDSVPLAAAFNGCATTGWSVTGAPQCPGFAGDALEADGAGSSWTIERTVDTTLLDGQLLLRFDLAQDGTDKDDSFAVAIDATGTWQTVFHQSGALRADPAFTTFVVDLGALEPAVLGNPSLALRFSATSSANNHKLDLDNVSLTASIGSCAASDVVLGAPVDQGGGGYSFAATATLPQPLQVVCTWGNEASLTDSASVQLTP